MYAARPPPATPLIAAAIDAPVDRENPAINAAITMTMNPIAAAICP